MPHTVAFLLAPALPLFTLAAALEVLRHANRAAGGTHFAWQLLSEGDRPLTDSAGLPLAPTASAQTCRAQTVLAVAGFGAAQWRAPGLQRHLAIAGARGALLGGLSNGAFLLARCGLLDGHLATVHREDFADFCRRFPRVRARYQRYTIDRQRASCSGGASTLELMLALVQRELGAAVVQQVQQQMLLDPAPALAAPCAASAGRPTSALVRRALSVMEGDESAGGDVAQLARQLGTSARTLRARFARELGESPGALQRRIRLARARTLVQRGTLSLQRIATATGFSSQSHFCACYRRAFHTTPGADRRAQQRH